MGECLLVRRGGSTVKIEAALRENLLKMGVTVPEKASVDELVSYVLSVPQGDISQVYFTAKLNGDAFAPTYGFYKADESAYETVTMPENAFEIDGLNKIKSIRVEIQIDSLPLPDISVPTGWSKTPITQIKKWGSTYSLSAIDNRFTLMEAMKEFSISVKAKRNCVVNMVASAVTEENKTINFEGDVSLRFQTNSWELLEAKYATWAELQSGNSTWSALETMSKN